MTNKKSRPGLAPQSGVNKKIYSLILALLRLACKVAALYLALGAVLWLAAHTPPLITGPIAVAALLWQAHDDIEVFYGR